VLAEGHDPKLRKIWRQTAVPVVFRNSSPAKLLVKVPPTDRNLEWLRESRPRLPVYNLKYGAWETPRTWFEPVIRLCIGRYQRCYVIQLHQERQVCAPACWKAEGIDCECSCMGSNHGSGIPDGRWYEIDETLAVSWGIQKYACRLMSSKKSE
jgi:hypothetical protein